MFLQLYTTRKRLAGEVRREVVHATREIKSLTGCSVAR